jgi:hypothetical protein
MIAWRVHRNNQQKRGISVKKIGSKIVIGTVIAGTALALSATAAQAAQWNSINGQNAVNGLWFQSTSQRHVTTANDTIQVQLNNVPAGQQWKIINAATGAQIGSIKSITTTAAVTLATGVNGNPTFYNAYKANTNASFTGNEYY